MGPIHCPETSVRNYHYTLRNSPEVCRFRLRGDGGLKSRIKYGCPSAHHEHIWGNGGIVPVIPNLVTSWSDGWTSRACHFTVGARSLDMHGIWNWLGTKTSLGALEYRKISCLWVPWTKELWHPFPSLVSVSTALIVHLRHRDSKFCRQFDRNKKNLYYCNSTT